MKVTMMLADHAQAVLGKLYIVGGGWSMMGPQPTPSALAIKIEVPWTETNHDHDLKVELLDERFQPIKVPTPAGESPVNLMTRFQVGRPAGWPQGVPLDVAVAFNLGPLSLRPGRYRWKLSLDGKSQDDWEAAFSFRSPAAQPQQPMS